MTKVLVLLKSKLNIIALAIIIALILIKGPLELSSMAQTAVLKTGIMNASTNSSERLEDFDYHFSVKNIEGKLVSLENYKGKVIFINLWATWCGPCRAEMPTIQELYNEVDHEKISFLMLSLDKAADQDKVLRYVAKKNYTFPVFMKEDQLPELLNVPSIPTTFIISKEGKVVSENVGTTNFNTKKFKQFLKEQSEK